MTPDFFLCCPILGCKLFQLWLCILWDQTWASKPAALGARGGMLEVPNQPRYARQASSQTWRGSARPISRNTDIPAALTKPDRPLVLNLPIPVPSASPGLSSRDLPVPEPVQPQLWDCPPKVLRSTRPCLMLSKEPWRSVHRRAPLPFLPSISCSPEQLQKVWGQCSGTGTTGAFTQGLERRFPVSQELEPPALQRDCFCSSPDWSPWLFSLKRSKAGRVKRGGKARAGMKRLPVLQSIPGGLPGSANLFPSAFCLSLPTVENTRAAKLRGSAQPRWETLLERQMVISII